MVVINVHHLTGLGLAAFQQIQDRLFQSGCVAS
jgi:hypothetical protein